jgi:hypothetical protein
MGNSRNMTTLNSQRMSRAGSSRRGGMANDFGEYRKQSHQIQEVQEEMEMTGGMLASNYNTPQLLPSIKMNGSYSVDNNL